MNNNTQDAIYDAAKLGRTKMFVFFIGCQVFNILSKVFPSFARVLNIKVVYLRCIHKASVTPNEKTSHILIFLMLYCTSLCTES